MLDRRRGPGDAERAAELRRAAIDDARRFGMSARADQWERACAPGAGTALECNRDGRVWLVRLGDRAAVVPQSVGMGYLAELIDHAGVEIAAVETVEWHTPSSGSTVSDQPVLDDRAKATYRRRIEELQHDIDDADVCADLERAARARAELDQFVTELARATGFAGRGRCFADEAERARVAVCKAIKRAVAMITEVEPVLGREIGARVVTGTRCVFRDG